MTFRALVPGLATKVLQPWRRPVDTPDVAKLFPLLAVLLTACISSPNAARTMTVVSVPAGATCTTSDGQVVTLPAELPCDDCGVTRVEVALAGYAPRQVELVTGPARPRLASFVMADLVGGLVGANLEQVCAREGEVVLELRPLSAPVEAHVLDPPALQPEAVDATLPVPTELEAPEEPGAPEEDVGVVGGA